MQIQFAVSRVPDAVRHSSCRSAEPGPYQAQVFVTAPALQRTASRRATRCAASGARDLASHREERRQPRLDILRDLRAGAVFGVAEGALAGEALQLAGDVVGDA